MTTTVHGFYSFVDEKEKQDPLAFRDAIIQGLQDIGNNDLEQVGVFVLPYGSWFFKITQKIIVIKAFLKETTFLNDQFISLLFYLQ